MVEVYSKALDEVIIVERIIHQVESSKPGPTLVFFGGIHGNEPAGIFALKKVLSQISESEIKGSIYAITGNLKALKTGQRFIDEDLNRIWSKSQVSTIGEIGAGNIEQSERQVLYDPVPIVLGIEEYLDGPLLSYINELGYVSLGFEAGQHEEEESISNSIAFIHLALSFAGAILKEDEEQVKINFKALETAANKSHTIFEIIHLHQILNGEEFKMKAGFKSFQDIQKGEKIAYSDEQIINSEFNAKIFMPLYQNKGKEGFFIIRPIKTIFLRLSALLRRFNLDGLLVALPGIKWRDKKEGALRVNLRTAKFLAKPIFHLFGYRNRHIDETHLKLYNRERVSKSEMYRKEFWYKNNL